MMLRYVPAIGLATGMLIGLGLYYGMGMPGLSGPASSGFGAEWTCAPQIKGGPICWRPAR